MQTINDRAKAVAAWIISVDFADNESWRKKQIREALSIVQYRIGVLLALLEKQRGELCDRISFQGGIGILDLVTYQIVAEFPNKTIVLWRGHPCRCCCCGWECDPDKSLKQKPEVHAEWEQLTHRLELKAAVNCLAKWTTLIVVVSVALFVYFF